MDLAQGISVLSASPAWCHWGRLAWEVEQRTWDEHLEDEVCEAWSEIERLSKELFHLKLALESIEATQRVMEQLIAKEQARLSTKIDRLRAKMVV